MTVILKLGWDLGGPRGLGLGEYVVFTEETETLSSELTAGLKKASALLQSELTLITQ